MIGYILTGHGSFAPGLMGALEMIAGGQESFDVIPFFEEDSLKSYEEKVAKSVEHMESEYPGVIVFTDLMGGTPFRTAMLAAGTRGKTEVIAGTNLPMLIEGCMVREDFSDAGELADMLVESGRSSVLHERLELKDDDAVESTEKEGI